MHQLLFVILCCLQEEGRQGIEKMVDEREIQWRIKEKWETEEIRTYPLPTPAFSKSEINYRLIVHTIIVKKKIIMIIWIIIPFAILIFAILKPFSNSLDPD